MSVPRFVKAAGILLCVFLVAINIAHGEWAAGAIFTLGAIGWMFPRTVAKGRREQVWEPSQQKRARMIEDLVWGNTVWINHADGGHETPEEGIARLHKELGRGR